MRQSHGIGTIADSLVRHAGDPSHCAPLSEALSDLSTTCVPWPGALTPAAARSGFLSTWDNWGYQVQPFAARAPLMILNGNHERDFPGTNDSFANPVFGPGTLTCPAIANTSSPYCITDSRGECGARPTPPYPNPVLPRRVRCAPAPVAAWLVAPSCRVPVRSAGGSHQGPGRSGALLAKGRAVVTCSARSD